MSQITQTNFLLPGYVVSNGEVTGNPWSYPEYLLYVDDLLSESNPNTGSASDIIVGGFNPNLPQDAVITGIEIEVIVKAGAITNPATTLTLYAVDNTSGQDVFFPYTAPLDLTLDLDTYTLGGINYLFGQSALTPDQVNNLKLQMVANGDLYVDSILLRAVYYIPDTPTPPAPVEGACETCNSPIQVPEMYLQVPFLIGETVFYLKPGSFQYADGTPVQPGDLGDCGGEIDLVFDEGQLKTISNNNFEENSSLDTSTGSWVVLPTGVIQVDIGSVNNRGLLPHTPYTHDASLMSDHDANSKVIISNNGRFYSRFVRRCQVDTVFSPPIEVQDEGITVTPTLHTLNFIGDSVQAEEDSMDPDKVNVTVLTNPANKTPGVIATSQGTTEAATSLTIPHTITTENYLRVWVSTDNQTISGVTFNGVALTLVASKTNSGANLKVALYGLVNPAAGTHNIVITMAGSSHISGGGVSFDNVDTASPTDGISAGAVGSSTAPSDSVTTTQQNTVLMDVVGAVTNTTGFTQGSLWNIESQVNAASRPGATSTRKVLVAATVTDTYTITPTGAWALIIAGVRGIAIPTGGVQTVTGLDTDNTDPANPIVNISVDGSSITGAGTPGDPLIAHTTGGGQTDIQFEDEGSSLGTPGTVDTVNFTGAGIAASRSGNTVTVNVPGGGSSVSLETDGTPNADQSVLNLISGANITLTPDGSGGVTIDAAGGGSGGSGGGVLHSFADSTPTAPSNTTPVIVDTYTIPANTFAVGDVIRITVGESITTNSSNSGQNDLEIGGSSILTLSSSVGPTWNQTVIITGVVKASTIEYSAIGLKEVSGTATVLDAVAAGSFAFNPAISNVVNAVVTSSTLLGGYSGSYNNLVIEKVGEGSTDDTLSVNADETESTNFTTQVDGPTSSTQTNGWTVVAAGSGPSYNALGSNSFGIVNTGFAGAIANAQMQIVAPSSSNKIQLSADTPNVFRLKFYAKVWTSAGSATNRVAVGFSNLTGGSDFYSEAATDGLDIKFVFDQNGATTYAVCSDGAAVTSVDLHVDPNTFHVYEIVVTPYTNAKFYIDGVLVQTITTHLYATGSQVMKLQVGSFNFANGTEIAVALHSLVFSLTV